MKQLDIGVEPISLDYKSSPQPLRQSSIKSESLATLLVWSNHSAPHQQILNPKDVGSFSGCYSLIVNSKDSLIVAFIVISTTELLINEISH